MWFPAQPVGIIFHFVCKSRAWVVVIYGACVPGGRAEAQSVQDLGSLAAAEVGLDSLGFIVQKNSIYHLETKVRDNCYVVFILGTVVDHLLDCFASFSSERQCIFIHGFAQKWVEQIAMVGAHFLKDLFFLFVWLNFV